MLARFVRAGHPARAIDYPWIDQEPNSGPAVQAERTRSDIALDQGRVGGEILLVECFQLGRCDLCGEPLLVDVTVTGNSDRQSLGGAVRVAQLDDDVFHRVGRCPRPLVASELGACVEMVDQCLDRRCVWCVND